MSYEKPVLQGNFNVAAALAAYVAVQLNSTADQVALAGANSVNIGFTRVPTTFVGEDTPIIMEGIAQAVVGSGGVSKGNRLKSGTAGEVLAIATSGTTIQQICAIALADGVQYDVIPVLVVHSSERPALA